MDSNGPYFDDFESKHDNWSNDMVQRFGWYAHFVPGDADFPNDINFHTHGIAESFGHPDLQICFPIHPDVAHQIFSLLVDNIKEGYCYQPGIKYPEIIQGDLCVEFIEARECGRQVLRIIFPNSDGNYEGEVFKSQFEIEQV